jgi:hypothetical protein
MESYPPRMPSADMGGEPTRQLALADAVEAAIKATLTPMVAPLVDELAACHRLIERLATEIAELREDWGRLTAELEARADALEWTQAQLDTARALISGREARDASGPHDVP